MDAIDTGRHSMADYSALCEARPTLDHEFAQAAIHMARSLMPEGWKVVPASVAPGTYRDLRTVCDKAGCMVVGDVEDEMGIFPDRASYQAFRAWHDWCHLYMGTSFDGTREPVLKTEAITARVQEAQLAAVYGPEKAKRWMRHVHDEIVTYNFGDASAIDESAMTITDAEVV